MLRSYFITVFGYTYVGIRLNLNEQIQLARQRGSVQPCLIQAISEFVRNPYLMFKENYHYIGIWHSKCH